MVIEKTHTQISRLQEWGAGVTKSREVFSLFEYVHGKTNKIMT